MKRNSLKEGNRILHHLQAMFKSLQRLGDAPFANFLIVAVISIALAIPTTLFILLLNLKQVGAGWQQKQTQLTVYLKPGLGEMRIQDLRRQINQRPDVLGVEYISSKAALDEFAEAADLKSIFATIRSNPIPAMFVIYPSHSSSAMAALTALQDSLKKIPQVIEVQLNSLWLERLFAMIKLGKRFIYAFGFLMIFGVLLVVGNVTRLTVMNRQHEMIVHRLVGASDGFIRRPFLYSGVWYGFFGGLMAVLFVFCVLSWLNQSVRELSSLYHSQFQISNFGLTFALNLILVSCLLGWIAAKLVLRRLNLHLQ